jgi:hypothetical protein
MRSAGLDIKFWSAVLPSIGYIRNISPSSTLGDMTPYEAWHGHKPDLSHLRPIGTPGLLLTPPKRKKSKLILDKGDPVKLIGYSETTTAIWKSLTGTTKSSLYQMSSLTKSSLTLTAPATQKQKTREPL